MFKSKKKNIKGKFSYHCGGCGVDCNASNATYMEIVPKAFGIRYMLIYAMCG